MDNQKKNKNSKDTSTSNASKNNKDLKKSKNDFADMMGPPPVGIFASMKGFMNTFVRLLPIGFYTGTIMSGFVFGDPRGTWLFLGLILNEFISYGYRMILNGIYNPQCALMKNGEDYFVLPSPITQTIGFIFGFFMTHMFFQKGPNKGFKPVSFFSFTALLVITIFSRINVGCTGFLEAIYCALVGIVFGIGYYNIIKDYYPTDVVREDEDEDNKSDDEKKASDFFEI